MRNKQAHHLLLRGGRLVDAGGERPGDLLIEGERIVAVGEGLDAPLGATVLEASGCIVAPGLVDLHTHLRQPGGEVAETLETGARAAALGGFTAVLAMPNTEPAIDCASVVRDIQALGATACAEIAVSGAITVGRCGERLAPLGEMADLGVRIFTDDGKGVQDAALMRHALEYGRDLGITLAQHCEDERLAAGGHMHEGVWSSRLGIGGQPALAEEAMVARDLGLVALTGTQMHFLHLSTAGSIALIARAKAEGLPVTAEITPHHLSLTDAEVASFDPVFKVNPPLRTDADVAALRAAALAGSIDAIATDHAPHAAETKEEPFESAPPGMLGLETALAVAFASLPELGLVGLFALLSWQPARIAGLDVTSGQGGPLVPGAIAHCCVFDPKATWTVDPARSASLSRNTPFAGRNLVGRIRHTLYRGEPVVIDGEATR